MAGLEMQIARIPVRIRPEFFLGAVLLGASRLSQPLLLAWWIFAVGFFVFLHELGHALMFRRFGHQPSIELQMLGGATSGTPGRPLSNREDFVVSLAGPMMGLLVAGTVWLSLRQLGQPASPLMQTVIADIMWINLGWSILNLLPILPLDGGRVFSAAMRHFFGDGRGRRIGYGVSFAVAVGVGLYAVSTGWMFMALFMGLYAVSSFNALRSGHSDHGAGF